MARKPKVFYALMLCCCIASCETSAKHYEPSHVARVVSEDTRHTATAPPDRDTSDLAKPGAAGEKVIAIFLDSYDWKSRQHTAFVLPFGRYVNGEYNAIFDTAATEGDEDAKPELGKSLVAKFLKLHPDYTIYDDGGPVGSAHVTNARTEQLECFPMVVGDVHTGLDTTILKANLRDFARQYDSTGADVTMTMSTFIAISGPANPSATGKTGNKIMPSKDVQRDLQRLVTRDIKQEFHYTSRVDSVRIYSVYNEDLDRDGIPEHIAVCSYYDTIGDGGHQFSYVVGYHERLNAIDTFFVGRTQIEESSWGSGYQFLSAIEIAPGETVLFFQADGYEDTTFLVYEYRKGKLMLMPVSGGYGC